MVRNTQLMPKSDDKEEDSDIHENKLKTVKGLRIHTKLLVDFNDFPQSGKSPNKLGEYIQSLSGSP